jgi:hypothetical protein
MIETGLSAARDFSVHNGYIPKSEMTATFTLRLANIPCGITHRQLLEYQYDISDKTIPSNPLTVTPALFTKLPNVSPKTIEYAKHVP